MKVGPELCAQKACIDITSQFIKQLAVAFMLYFFRYSEIKFVPKRQTARKKGFTPVTTINIRRPVSLPPLNSFKNLYSGILNNEECSEPELQSEKSLSAKKGLK